jgi:acyl-Coa thioesterase superfamily protein/acyl-CoA thioesterase superfamily protein
MADDGALFIPDGERFISTELTRGPWTPEAQHGGPPAALLARAVEHVPGGEGMMVVRLTVELLRPVPVAPLVVTARLVRPGRKVQLLESSMRAGDVEVARAIALRIRTADLPVPAPAVAEILPPTPETGSTSLPPWGAAIAYRSFHRDGVEHRFVAGSFTEPGPATDWIRLRVPLVAGEPTSPLARVAAAADFANGISWELSRTDGWQFINPDLTIYLHRHPAGEWVCLESRTVAGPYGVGFTESRLWDGRGSIGSSLQSLLLDRQ